MGARMSVSVTIKCEGEMEWRERGCKRESVKGGRQKWCQKFRWWELEEQRKEKNW